MAANTGRGLGAEAWRDRVEKRAEVARQTDAIASALERQGIQCRTPTGIVALGEVTGELEMLEGWRAIRILPLVAQRDRRPLLNALRWFHSHTPGGKYIRMAVVTSGQRVPWFGDLKGRQQKHSRDISRWAHEARTWGVEVLFRGTEYTVADEGIHLHSNILMRPTEAMDKDVWRAFLRWTRGRLGGVQWRDCGRLEKPEEAIKYTVKPCELEGRPDDALAWLYEQTYRAKHAQPMGAFKEFVADLEADRCKVAMVHQGDSGMRLRIVEKPAREKREGGDGPGENAIVARTLPQARFSPWAEPCSLVLNYQPQPTTPDGWRRLVILNLRADQARAWWDDNGAPLPSVALATGQGQAAAEQGRAQAVLPFPVRVAAGAAFNVHTCRPTVPTSVHPGQSTAPPRAPPRPLSTASLGDGTVFDPATGEILWEPPADRPAQQAHASAYVRERLDATMRECGLVATTSLDAPRKRKMFRTTLDDLDRRAMAVVVSESD